MIKRRSKDGLVFFNEDRTYRSKPFKTEDDRDLAIEEYKQDQIKLRKEAEDRRKKEYELTHR